VEDLSLEKLDEVRLAIATSTTVQEIKGAIDWIRTLKSHVERTQKDNKDTKLRVIEYEVRSERKLGEMLIAAKANGQITHAHKGKNLVVPDENNKVFTLKQAGIDRKLSSEAQRIASIPVNDFEKKVTELRESGKLTVKAVARIVQANGKKPGKGKPVCDTKPHCQEKEFYAAVNQRVQQFLEQTIGPKLEEEQAQLREIVQSRKGILNRKAYRKILSCLHPDKVTDPDQKEVYREAFLLFTKMEKLVLDEKESPTEFVSIPKTKVEWEEAKRKAATARKTARPSAKHLSRKVA
jgi:hypothetical protein